MPLKYEYTDEQEAFVLDNCVTASEEDWLRAFYPDVKDWDEALDSLRLANELHAQGKDSEQ